MTLRDILNEKSISLYQLSKNIDVPYSTLSDLANKKTTIESCTVLTAKRIADGLNMSIDSLYELLKKEQYRADPFDVFKSNVCHRVKEDGHLEFIKDVLTTDIITTYWNEEEYAKAFYLLAMVDFLSKKNHIPLYAKYNLYRTKKLTNKIYPSSMVIKSTICNVDIETLIHNPIEEFLKYNIVEGDIYDSI